MMEELLIGRSKNRKNQRNEKNSKKATAFWRIK
jgi:hypothetical protein